MWAGGGLLVPTGVPKLRSPLPLLLADGVGRAEGAAPPEPADPEGADPGAISLRPVESISDLHWASAGHKGSEGESRAADTRARLLNPVGSVARH